MSFLTSWRSTPATPTIREKRRNIRSRSHAYRARNFEMLELRLLLSFTEIPGESIGLPTGMPNWAKSIAWADANNDGWVDFNCRCGVYLNDGGTFTGGHGGGAESDSFWGDVNNDGWLDIHYTKAGAEPTFMISRGESGGFDTFSIPDIAFSRSMASVLGDYNGDGWLDVYIGGSETWGAGSHPDRLFINRPDSSKPGGRTF